MKPIIIADDNEPHRKDREGFLSRHYKTQVDGVRNGQELVEKVREGDYAFIVTDYQMPVCDGIEAVRRIREFNPRIPIVVVSGSEVESFALEVGATAYLEKPAFFEELTEIIDGLQIE